MKVTKLGRLIVQSIRRNKRDLALSSVGIIVGISTLLLFTALGSGIRTVVLEDIFRVRQLEVVPKSVGGLGSMMGGEPEGLTDETVERIREIPGVEEAYPTMKFTFPSSVRGGEEILGKDLVAELVADGIPPTLIDKDLRGEVAFEDFEADRSCSAEAGCPAGSSCRDGKCVKQSCGPGDTGEDCEGPSYCDTKEGVCRMPIPAVVNPRVLEIYNGSLRTAADLPELTDDLLYGLQATAIFGKSYLGSSSEGEVFERKLRLVGFTDRAIDMGATIPIGYVQRFNRHFGTETEGPNYHAIRVVTTSNEAITPVAETIRGDLNLELSEDYENAQRAGFLIMVLTLVFDLISVIILAIAAVNIMHTFLMILLERRREIGLMRALGATKWNIRWMVLGESTLLGLVGGLSGVLAGWGMIEGVDYLFQTQVADFPFKPESLFVVQAWMPLAAVAVAVVFCWIGAFLPAFRASGIDPAEALTKG